MRRASALLRTNRHLSTAARKHTRLDKTLEKANVCTVEKEVAKPWTVFDGYTLVGSFLFGYSLTTTWKMNKDTPVASFRALKSIAMSAGMSVLWPLTFMTCFDMAADHPSVRL